MEQASVLPLLGHAHPHTLHLIIIQRASVIVMPIVEVTCRRIS